jgi:hypothetical protein
MLSGALIYSCRDFFKILPEQTQTYRYLHFALIVVLILQTVLQLIFLE